MKKEIIFDNNELVYDNLKSKQKKKQIKINKDILIVNFDDIIRTQFSGGNIDEGSDELKNKLHLGQYSKAPCGGFVNLYKINPEDNNRSYIIFSGVKEVSNSHYIVTIHRVFEW